MFPVFLSLLGFQSLVTDLSYFQKCKFNENIHMTKKTHRKSRTVSNMETVWKLIENSRLQGPLLSLSAWPTCIWAMASTYKLCNPLLCMSPSTSFVCPIHTLVPFMAPSTLVLWNFLALASLANWVSLSAFPALNFFRLWLAMFVPVLATRWTHKLLAWFGFSYVKFKEREDHRGTRKMIFLIAMWGYSKKTAIWKAGRGFSPGTKLVSPLILGFSCLQNCEKWKWKSFTRIQLFATPWNSPWNSLFPSPGDLPNPRI